MAKIKKPAKNENIIVRPPVVVVMELGGWALVVAGRIRGVDVLLSCSREDMALLEVERWNA